MVLGFDIFRARFGRDIIAEFMPSAYPSNKVVIVTPGCPGYPGNKRDLMQLLSRKGYWSIVPSYRGTWESGGMFLEYPPSDDVIIIIDELSLGFRDLWSSAEYRIEDPQIYLLGASFGGPAAILASRDARVKKAATISAVTDWRDQEHTVEPLHLMDQYVASAYGMAYRTNEKVYAKLAQGDFYNPTHEQSSIDGSKLLLIHALDDKVVHHAPAETFAKATGAKLITLRSGGHMGVRSATVPSLWRVIERHFSGKK